MQQHKFIWIYSLSSWIQKDFQVRVSRTNNLILLKDYTKLSRTSFFFNLQLISITLSFYWLVSLSSHLLYLFYLQVTRICSMTSFVFLASYSCRTSELTHTHTHTLATPQESKQINRFICVSNYLRLKIESKWIPKLVECRATIIME